MSDCRDLHLGYGTAGDADASWSVLPLSANDKMFDDLVREQLYLPSGAPDDVLMTTPHGEIADVMLVTPQAKSTVACDLWAHSDRLLWFMGRFCLWIPVGLSGRLPGAVSGAVAGGRSTLQVHKGSALACDYTMCLKVFGQNSPIFRPIVGLFLTESLQTHRLFLGQNACDP